MTKARAGIVRRVVAVALLLLLLPVSPGAIAQQAAGGELRDVTVSTQPDSVTVLVKTSGEPKYQAELMDHPYRLVVDTKGFNDLSWFDRAGNFHSDALHVVERFTPRSAETINYEVTIEDPKVFSRPWKMSMPLYKHVERNAQILEFRCVEFVEDLLYGHLRKQPAK